MLPDIAISMTTSRAESCSGGSPPSSSSDVALTLNPSVAETITVTAEAPLLDIRKTGTGVNVTKIELEKIQATQDIDGKSLLHNSMIVYGSGNADANRHTHDNLPVVLAGAGGGTLTPGRYVKHGSKPMTNLFLSMADRLGLRGLERFGDSTGRLENV